jgi:hypothetical protein
MDHNKDSMKAIVTVSLLNFHYWLCVNGATTYVEWLELNKAVKKETKQSLRDLQLEPGNAIFNKLKTEGGYGINFLTMSS